MNVITLDQIREAKFLHEAAQKSGGTNRSLSDVLKTVQSLETSAENDDKNSSWQKRKQRRSDSK
ncbi:MAG: hypothetical protein H6625_08765 [Bdellovibrionaceae bacterium]|nr:hypothetical protein [Pseudobdellovibrionaceae bacterium]|tara:strand:- start:856 stop:1047 length:192 start_codon:yes stop_codon:yes gene_type:complete